MESVAGIATVQLDAGAIAHGAHSHELAAGQRVAMTIRPDDIQLMADDTHEQYRNRLCGRVTKVSFLGTHRQVVVTTGDSIELMIRQPPATTSNPPGPDETVSIGWASERSTCFPVDRVKARGKAKRQTNQWRRGMMKSNSGWTRRRVLQGIAGAGIGSAASHLVIPAKAANLQGPVQCIHLGWTHHPDRGRRFPEGNRRQTQFHWCVRQLGEPGQGQARRRRTIRHRWCRCAVGAEILPGRRDRGLRYGLMAAIQRHV